MVFGSGLGIVLSLVFGCLLLALIGELYYLLWWKNLSNNAAPANPASNEEAKDAGGVEAELLRLQNRLLFTINEETKEDLESEAAKSSRKGSRTRSLSDLIMADDESPSNVGPLFQGFNPLFESEVGGLRGCSPPPKMKFLRDAEEKLKRRLEEEGGSSVDEELGEGSFVRIVFGRSSHGCSH